MQKTFEILKVYRQDVLKETMKKLTFPLHPVPNYGQDHKKKGVELVTNLSLSFKICLDKFIFWCDPLNLKTGKERKNQQNIQHLKNEKSFLETR